MFEAAKRFLAQFFARASGSEGDKDDLPDDRAAGTPAGIRRGPPDRGSAVAVAEPDE